MTTGPPGYEKGGGSWGLSLPDAEPPPDPLTRRLRQLVGGLALLLIALVAFAWLHGSSETSLNPIAEAAERTEATVGARIAFNATYTAPALPRPLVMHGHGVHNGRTGRGRASMTMPLPTGELSIETVYGGRSVYMRSATLTAGLPPGKDWLGMEPLLGHDPETAFAGNGNPEQQLQMLKAAGSDVEEVGEEVIRGVSATRYQGTVDLQRMATMLRGEGKADFAQLIERVTRFGSSEIPVEVWIDEDGIVRRTREISTIRTEPDRPAIEMDMQIDLYDFGVEPDVRLPPAHAVFDATPLARAELGLLGEPAHGPAPPGGPALTHAAFQARIDGICNDMKRGFNRLRHQGEPLTRKAVGVTRREGLRSPATLRAFQDAALHYYEPMVDVVADGVVRLRRIPPPAALKGIYRRYLSLSALQLDLLTAQTRALEVGEYKLVDRLSDRLDQLADPAKALADKLGIESCEDLDKP